MVTDFYGTLPMFYQNTEVWDVCYQSTDLRRHSGCFT